MEQNLPPPDRYELSPSGKEAIEKILHDTAEKLDLAIPTTQSFSAILPVEHPKKISFRLPEFFHEQNWEPPRSLALSLPPGEIGFEWLQSANNQYKLVATYVSNDEQTTYLFDREVTADGDAVIVCKQRLSGYKSLDMLTISEGAFLEFLQQITNDDSPEQPILLEQPSRNLTREELTSELSRITKEGRGDVYRSQYFYLAKEIFGISLGFSIAEDPNGKKYSLVAATSNMVIEYTSKQDKDGTSEQTITPRRLSELNESEMLKTLKGYSTLVSHEFPS